jgi:hypothetical protein
MPRGFWDLRPLLKGYIKKLGKPMNSNKKLKRMNILLNRDGIFAPLSFRLVRNLLSTA